MVGVIILAGHLTGCLWYITGRLNYADALEKFLSSQGIDRDTTLSGEPENMPRVSWLQVTLMLPTWPDLT